ncbi:MAG: 5-dehydro-2-deoxygluconokinase [Clostridium tyrobutyricum]|jgi:5-dehydro-2-deoxygluconokinase|uniref:5-dehydro-2-deoxygluconokinase n=1 Tax=Clostridium tyrobutyricum TaxID=1519 RepID=UPI00243123D4|nr:5-dehydro-2-deoxygluconokinase [Clostridium tyrobutyricum]MCH4200190.1 5-dehydro-2-deoxygluconokinase [Clostridium tyrobutyricum]MCH4237212.1 5-dehydro-2-deoxygluconokinase [Clostridium tyrobutyricum]MCH4258980.1 5-dehydro-2-deoxygluconokinase [Clostridium tyrobutyricum]MCI1239831.1 5-dehydro-2-deoxygluconokinase [Clostridium tyrobutyricum]MCI1653023.1 5-dehydro-2-deoxygluconokinase [Clostridium tyrobutyricum]
MQYIQFDNGRKFDVIPLGRVTIDLNPVEINRTLAQSATFKKYLGGSPANVAVGLARLGKKVGFIGKISDDRFGDFIIDYFKKEGIDVSQIYRAENGESLGLTFTEILSPTESSILMYRNSIADLSLNVDEIDEDYIRNTKAISISGTALAQSPSREAALKAMEYAKKHNTIVIFDIDYRKYNWKNKDEIAIYYSMMGKNSDLVIGSREEFNLMEGLVAENSSDIETANRWIGYGNKIVVIKHGKDGSTAYTEDGRKYSIKPFPVKLMKSFGGGDAYGSAFIYGLLEGWDIIDALELGSASAAMLVASHSCSDAMPKVEEIKKFIKEEKAKYGEMVARY